MLTFCPVWISILDSSVWHEPHFVRVLFISMLAMKDVNHVVYGTAFQIASRAHLTEEEVIKGLKVLSSPDRHRIEPQPFEGRRLERVEGGWRFLNGQKYQELMWQAKKERRRMQQAASARRQRAKKKAMREGTPLPGEQAYCEAARNGADQETLDRISDSTLPSLGEHI